MKPDRTMRLDSLAMVNRIAEARAELLRQLELVRNPLANWLAVLVGSETLDAAFVALVRPVVERELLARVAEAERDLEALGVAVSKHVDAAGQSAG